MEKNTGLLRIHGEQTGEKMDLVMYLLIWIVEFLVIFTMFSMKAKNFLNNNKQLLFNYMKLLKELGLRMN